MFLLIISLFRSARRQHGLVAVLFLVSVTQLGVKADFLLVSNNSLNSVLRYDAATGAFIDQFVPGNNSFPGAGGLVSPTGLAIGPDGNLYVGSGISASGPAHPAGVLRYNGTTGAFIDVFATLPRINGAEGSPKGMLFGPDGNLYVSGGGRVDRFNGQTGAFIDVFTNGGDPQGIEGITFGPNGNLFVSSKNTGSVKEFDGQTGQFVRDFVTPLESANTQPYGLAFGPDGNLYASSSGGNPPVGVRRYDGGNGDFIDNFAADSELVIPWGLVFAPDGDLYVARYDGAGKVKQFDGTSGEFINDFVPTGPAHDPNWLVGPTYLIFVSATPVPEPGSLLLCGAGAALIVLAWRKHAGRTLRKPER